MSLLFPRAQDLVVEGIKFRDLNKNGRLDVYEDNRQSIDDRVDDLISQMTIEEKAGSMFINMIGMTDEGNLLELPIISSNPLFFLLSMVFPSNSEMIIKKHMNSFNIIDSYPANILARYNNNIQKIPEEIFPPIKNSFNLSPFSSVLFEIPPARVKSGVTFFIQPKEELNSRKVSESISKLLNQTSPYSPFMNWISKKPSNSSLSVPAFAYVPALIPILGFKASIDCLVV